MDNTLMVTLQSQRVLQRRMDIAAMNMANVSTTGFKADELVMEEAANTNASETDNPRNVRFVRDVTVMRDMTQGPITQTGNALDAAIEGSGYFTVKGPNGPLYTRDGSFTLNSDGQLSTADGHLVLDTGGTPITIDAQGGSITIGRDGAVSVDGSEVARIGVVDFDRPGALEKVGGNLLSAGAQPSKTFEGVVIQGSLESSNVNPVLELTNLIDISRAYESAARIVSNADDLRQRAIDRLGRVG